MTLSTLPTRTELHHEAPAAGPVPAPARRTPASRLPLAMLRSHVDVEVVIPAYNEESRLPITLAQVVRELAALDGLSSRVVVVDNASSDRTSEVVDRFDRQAGSDVEVIAIGCATRGKGAAVRRGMLSSTASVVGFVDADLSVPTSVLPGAIAGIRRGQDVVIASRRAAGASYEVKQPRFRQIGSWGFRSAIAALVPGVTDSQCGFKFFSLDAARRIFNDMDVAGFAFDVEVLMRAARHDYTVIELPVAWTDDKASTLGLASHAPEIARDIVRLHRIDAVLERRGRFAPSRTAPVVSVTRPAVALRRDESVRAASSGSDDALLGVA